MYSSHTYSKNQTTYINLGSTLHTLHPFSLTNVHAAPYRSKQWLGQRKVIV